MPCVFISHSSLDREVVEREIISPLRAHGVDTWYSTADIQTASEWERQIHKGLMTCDWFLVALSPRAVDSEWVRREVHWAVMKRNNKIVPVMLETCEPEDLHLGLLPIQYIDFRGGGGPGLERLLAVWGLDKATQVKGLYRDAQDAITREDWASAAGKLEAVLRLDPMHSESRAALEEVRRQEYLAASYAVGTTAVRQGQWREALETLRPLREAAGQYKEIDELIALAGAQLEKEGAERLYREAVEAVEREEWATAAEKFQEVLNINPSHVEAQVGLNNALQRKELTELYAAGLAHLEAGRWGEALKMFRRVRLIDRSYQGVAELIADADAGLAEEEESRMSMEEQAERQARPAQSLAEGGIRGTANVALTGNREAPEALQTAGGNSWARKYTPSKVLAMSVGVIVLFIVVLALLQRANTSHSDTAATPGGTAATPIDAAATPTTDTLAQGVDHYERARDLIAQRQYAAAEVESRKAVDIDPDNAAYHNSLGIALHHQEKYVEAEAEYRRAIELTPFNADYRVDFAIFLHGQNRHAEEAAERRTALGIDPINSRAKLNLDHLGPPQNADNRRPRNANNSMPGNANNGGPRNANSRRPRNASSRRPEIMGNRNN